MKQEYRMLRVPEKLYERVTRLAEEIRTVKELAQGYDDVPLTEQGERGTWVPLYAVINRALDEFEQHRIRSNAPRVKPTPKRKGKRKR